MNIIPHINYDRCYLWQYDNSAKLNGILNFRKKFIDETAMNFISGWQYDIFNIVSANSFGLELWGRILGLLRPSYTNSESIETPISDGLYRRLLIGRIMRFNMIGSVSEINKYLTFVFGGNKRSVYIENYYNMSVRINAKAEEGYEYTEEEIAMLGRADIVPVPAGVKSNISVITNSQVFGYSGSGLYNFNTGEEEAEKQGGVFLS